MDIRELLENRNFQSLLAGMGAGLDPKGVGGAIGIPTQQMVKTLASQEATKEANLADKEWRDMIVKMLRMGRTPAEMPGMTGYTVDGNRITLKGTLPKEDELSFGDLSMGPLKDKAPPELSNTDLLGKYMELSPFS